MPRREPSPRTTRWLRVAMLATIGLVALANAAGWVDADLWIPFVCIIAVMGVGTRGGPVDSLSFVLLEAAVVMLLGVATFTGSRDAIWASSVAISVLAIGKIATVELHRRDLEASDAGLPRASVAPGADPRVEARVEASAEASAEASVEPGGEPSRSGARPIADERPAAPRESKQPSEPPPAPIQPQPVPTPRVPETAFAPASEPEAPLPKKSRGRDDETPRSVRRPRV